jgi:hypothetical protein
MSVAAVIRVPDNQFPAVFTSKLCKGPQIDMKIKSEGVEAYMVRIKLFSSLLP